MIERRIKLKNSINLNVRYTEDSKKTILFIHFSEGTNQIFNGIIPHFIDSYRIVAPDLRGHGKSDKPRQGYHIENMAEDINYLLEELNITCCHIVGSSLGAEVAVAFAAAHPEKVLSLVCEGALYNEFGEYGLFKGSEEEIKEEKERRNNKFASKKQLTFDSESEIINKQISRFKDDGIWNEHFEGFVESNVSQDEEGRYIFSTPLYVSVDYNSHYWNFEFEKYYKRIKCPILFILSEVEWRNQGIKQCLSAFCKFIDDYEVQHIEGGKHAFVWMQYAETMSSIVGNFIEKNKSGV